MRKLNHTECVMYRTVSNDFSEEEIKNFDYDMMLFFSPTGVKALKKNFPNLNKGISLLALLVLLQQNG